ncbi:hypothetical protein Tco_1120176, partial [Tanacetum coccineum]
RKNEILWRTSVGIERKFAVSAVWESIRPRGQEVEWFRVVWLNIEKLDENIVQKHGGSKQVGFKQLGHKQVGFKQLGPGVETGFHGVQDKKNVFGLRWNCRDREAEVFQVSNDDTAMAQRRLEDKQPKEKTNTDCLVKEQEKGNVAGKKKVKESMKANLGKLLKYIDKADLHNVPSCLEDISNWLIPMASKRSIVSVVSQLVFAASTYFIWQERNNRIYSKDSRKEEHICDVIMEMVRMKITTFKFKRTSMVLKTLATWRITAAQT